MYRRREYFSYSVSCHIIKPFLLFGARVSEYLNKNRLISDISYCTRYLQCFHSAAPVRLPISRLTPDKGVVFSLYSPHKVCISIVAQHDATMPLTVIKLHANAPAKLRFPCVDIIKVFSYRNAGRLDLHVGDGVRRCVVSNRITLCSTCDFDDDV